MFAGMAMSLQIRLDRDKIAARVDHQFIEH